MADEAVPPVTPPKPKKYRRYLKSHTEKIRRALKNDGALDGTTDRRSLASSVLDDPIVRGIVVGAIAAGATTPIAASIAIAQGFHVSADMIRKKKLDDEIFREELDTAAARSDSMVVLSLYRKATQGQDTTAMIFWLKNRQPHFWRERRELEIHIPDITGTLRSAAERARERKKLMLEAVEAEAITIESEIEPFVPGSNGSNGNGNDGHGG